jgi:hypothetical protein
MLLAPIAWLWISCFSFGAEDLIKSRPEKLNTDWLLQTTVRSCRFRFNQYHGRTTAYDDNRRQIYSLVPSNRADKMKAALSGQGYVGDYQVGLQLARYRQTLFRFGRGAYGISPQPK